MNLLEHFITIIAPHECLSCGLEGQLVCAKCRDQYILPLPPRCYKCSRLSADWRVCSACRKNKSPLRTVAVCTQYEGLPKEIMHVLKFERASAAAQTIAECLDPMQKYFDESCLITEVPTASSRRRQRGYDQAQLIAKAYAKQTNTTYTPFLWRMGNTRQVGMDRATRFTQAQSMFRVRNPNTLRGQHIILVDDVLTTGATIEAAARCLRLAGAASVSAILFAHRT